MGWWIFVTRQEPVAVQRVQPRSHCWLAPAGQCGLGDEVTPLTWLVTEPALESVGRVVVYCRVSSGDQKADLLVTTADFDGDRTWFAPDEVRLAVEVVSPESAHRDRTVKLHEYAEAVIPHYWRIEDEDGAPIVHVYELDEPTATYVPVGIFRGSLNRPVPFEINLDLEKLAPPRRG
ncbi:Uma2 family endonuclease [Streptomyces finlayi]|uniref:Uma2 family endonuclease n=1 Tax=Streptomyces finlayi TaxID=67296 RepID=A0A7G7BIL4_9ACTN|nr:Uma2 family endonuclease [Streptomyces finlayi]